MWTRGWWSDRTAGSWAARPPVLAVCRSVHCTKSRRCRLVSRHSWAEETLPGYGRIGRRALGVGDGVGGGFRCSSHVDGDDDNDEGGGGRRLVMARAVSAARARRDATRSLKEDALARCSQVLALTALPRRYEPEKKRSSVHGDNHD